jgi:leucyl aminopeptidase
MNFEIKPLSNERVCAEKCDALLVLLPLNFQAADDAVSTLANLAIKSGDLQTKVGQLLTTYRPADISATRLVFVGAGDGSAKSVRTAVNAAITSIKGSSAKRVVIDLNFLSTAANAHASAAVLAAADACYVFTTTKPKASVSAIERIVLTAATLPAVAAMKAGFEAGVALAKGVDLAKEWGNRPANHATPTMLANAAKELGKLPGIKVEVLGPKEVAKLGMGSFISVAKGSREELRFIVLHYSGAAKTAAPVVLVGKGITFDTGGISIKPSADMDEMKFDMCGAASVLGTFRTLADLKPAINVVGLIPSCENMPDGNAVKPGDVVTSMSGQTIENLNTDAEGRLVLCDALTYAERFNPSAVVDIATLTGACVVALGAVRSGLFSADEQLAKRLLDAGDTALDLCWRLPLDDDYAEGLKSNFADVANVAGRAGGAVTAAKFLQRFTTKFPWAHLDIAGTAWKSGKAKGSTGRPVGLLVEFLLATAALPAQQLPKAATKVVTKARAKSAANSAPTTALKVPKIPKAPAKRVAKPRQTSPTRAA